LRETSYDACESDNSQGGTMLALSIGCGKEKQEPGAIGLGQQSHRAGWSAGPDCLSHNAITRKRSAFPAKFLLTRAPRMLRMAIDN